MTLFSILLNNNNNKDILTSNKPVMANFIPKTLEFYPNFFYVQKKASWNNTVLLLHVTMLFPINFFPSLLFQ